jgi:hypothetical protein
VKPQAFRVGLRVLVSELTAVCALTVEMATTRRL